MGRGTEEKMTYLNIMQGSVVERLHKSTEHRKEQFTKEWLQENFPGRNTQVREYINDSNVWEFTIIEQRDDFISGYVEDVKVESGNYGPIIRIVMNDGTEKFIVQMKQNSSTGLWFMKCFPNVNPAIALKLRPWKSQNGEGIQLSQDGTEVKPKWSKDDMGDYPLAPEFAGTVDYAKWTPKQKREYDSYKNVRLDFVEAHLLKHAELFGPYDGESDDEMQAASDANRASLETTPEEKTKKERGVKVETAEGTKNVNQSTMEMEEDDSDLPF